MLVLSRRPNEKIVLPGIDTSFQIVSIKPGVVRLGISAPPEVAVFREEVWLRDHPNELTGYLLHERGQEARIRELNHVLRNQVNHVQIGLDLLSRQLEAGMLPGAQKTIRTMKAGLAEMNEEAEKFSPPEEPEVQDASASPRRALLAEDNQNERELFAGLLRMAGLEVDTAGNGQAVLDYIDKRQVPDVLLLDMRMPELDGPSTLRALQDNPACRRMKVFAVTGHDPREFGIDLNDRTVSRWFRKPLQPERLLRELSAELKVSN